MRTLSPNATAVALMVRLNYEGLSLQLELNNSHCLDYSGMKSFLLKNYVIALYRYRRHKVATNTSGRVRFRSQPRERYH